jgi:hypothetical protein
MPKIFFKILGSIKIVICNLQRYIGKINFNLDEHKTTIKLNT